MNHYDHCFQLLVQETSGSICQHTFLYYSISSMNENMLFQNPQCRKKKKTRTREQIFAHYYYNGSGCCMGNRVNFMLQCDTNRTGDEKMVPLHLHLHLHPQTPTTPCHGLSKIDKTLDPETNMQAYENFRPSLFRRYQISDKFHQTLQQDIKIVGQK